MHLLSYNDGSGFSLTKFLDDILPYAILSHTWGSEEVTFKDIIEGNGANKAGFSKNQFCGEQTKLDGWQYFWVDTCCIDKSSSAELTEAISSMYRWYQQAQCCYAYIDDWQPEHTWTNLTSIVPVDDNRSYNKLQVMRIATDDQEIEEDMASGSICNTQSFDGRVYDEQMHESNEGQDTKEEHTAFENTTCQADISESSRSDDRKDYGFEGKLANAVSQQTKLC
jgi:hypothetical protein